MLLGVCEDGHTASLFPNHPALNENRRWVVPVVHAPKPPSIRITLTLMDTLWLPTTEADSFAQLLEQLRSSDFSLPADEADIAVIAVAGPVEHASYCAPPYIAWDIDLAREGVANSFQQAVLINDFVAQAYACRSPLGQSARKVLPGEIIANGTVGVLGAGTALGKAILVPVSTGDFLALPSEG